MCIYIYVYTCIYTIYDGNCTFVIINNCICFCYIYIYRNTYIGRNCFRTYTFQTGGCDNCFPDPPNFAVDDLTRNGLTVAVYEDLLFGLLLIDSRRIVYETTTNTETNNTANTFTTNGSLFMCNFCLTNSDIIELPVALKHDDNGILCVLIT